MGRALLLVAAAVVGTLAIVLSVQELGSGPQVVPTEEERPEVGTARSVVVRIEDREFVPGNVTIRPGQTVRWSNRDRTEHTVTKVSGPGDDFDSGEISPGGSFERTFVDAGVFEYRCELHPGRMRGTVTVLE